MQEERTEQDAHRDERGSEPPAEGGPEESQEGQRDEPGEAPGPLGNPESDEEALSHRQQEGDSDA